MESPSWFNGWDTGTTVEGRIATALLDISDRPQAAEWSWDRVGDGDAAVWAAFRRQPVDTWDQFADLLRAEVDGQSLAATLYENTLAGARSFTDPLVDGGEVTRPAYGPVESYRFGVSGGRWAAAAVRPGAAVNKNLYMFDSVGGSVLKLSAASGSDVDFVPLSPARSGEHEAWAIFDGNGVDRRRAGQYQIEYAEGPELARGSAETVHLGEQDVLVVRGVELTEHVRTLLGVSTVSGSPDLEVFLVRDLETRDEVPADRQAPSPGFGGTRWVDVTPATGEGGSYGLVVVNRAGAGEVELRYF